MEYDSMVKIYPVDSFGLVHRELIASGFLISIASLALFLRLAARRAKKIPLWWDDYTIIAVWVRQCEREGRIRGSDSLNVFVLTLTDHTLGNVCHTNKMYDSIREFKDGNNTTNLRLRRSIWLGGSNDYNSSRELDTNAEGRLSLKFFVLHNSEVERLASIKQILPGFQLLWGTAMSLAKFSYMFFYLSVFQASQRFRILTFGCMTVVALWWIANVLQIFLICRPFKMNWDSTVQGTCGNRPLTYALVGAVNIATDVTTLLLPVPTVWGLQMPKRLKVGITAIFCIGLLYDFFHLFS